MNAQTMGFVERMGLALESDSLPRIAGRMFGLLLLSEDCRSLDDLAAELGVSKGSGSTNARLLEQRGVLESEFIHEGLIRWQVQREHQPAVAGLHR